MAVEAAVYDDVRCAECGAILPPERRRTPWCECGWSSAPDPAVEHYQVSDRARKRAQARVARERQAGRARAERDRQLLQGMDHPLGQLLWSSRLLLALGLASIVHGVRNIVALSLPVLTVVSVVHKFWLGVMLGATAMALFWLLLRQPRREPGYALMPEATQELHAVVADLARKAGVRPPDQIRLVPGAIVAVYQRLAWVPWPRTRRVLIVGLLALHALSVQQLRAAVAHELGHLRNRDTVIGNYLAGALYSLEDLVGPGGLFPGLMRARGFGAGIVWLGALVGQVIARSYLRVFSVVAMAAARRQELMADRFAAELVGVRAVTTGLIEIGATQAAFDAHEGSIGHSIVHGADQRDWYTQFKYIWSCYSAEGRQQFYAEAVASFRSRYDSHPTYQDRYAALQFLCGSEGHTEEHEIRPAISLLPNPEKIGAFLTQRWLEGS